EKPASQARSDESLEVLPSKPCNQCGRVGEQGPYRAVDGYKEARAPTRNTSGRAYCDIVAIVRTNRWTATAARSPGLVAGAGAIPSTIWSTTYRPAREGRAD